MSVQYKGGVNFDVIPQIRSAISQAETIFSRYGYILIITSAKDSTHESGSLHYIGAAVDFRSKGLPENIKQEIFRQLQAVFRLPVWWIDLENLGGLQEHYHLEYKPAKRVDIDIYSVDPADWMTSFLPGEPDNVLFPQPEPPIEQPYPQYPPGTIPPQYFTPYEQPVDWKIILLAAVGVYLLIEFTS
jgi:hypothetical protein